MAQHADGTAALSSIVQSHLNCRLLEQERLIKGLLGCLSLKELLTSLAPDALAHLLQILPEVTVMNVSWQS